MRFLQVTPHFQMATQAPITHFTRTRVAIVTGGAQGIGKAIALRLAADGFDICVDDVASKTHLLKEVVAEIQQLGRKAIALPYDVTKEQEVKEMVEKTVAELGGLDVVTYLWTTPVCLFLMTLPPQDGCECWNRTRLERPLGRYSNLHFTYAFSSTSNICHPANIDEWESIWAVNMRGTVLCYKYAAIQMVKQNSGGRLIGM